MPQLLSNDFMKDLPEITSSKYFEKKKRYHRNGLFSEYIFGLENNYTCYCGIYHGKGAEGTVCNEKCCDGLPITHSIKRRRQYAKIVLPIPVLNKTFMLLLKKVFPHDKIAENIANLMKSYKHILYEKNNEYFLRDFDEDEDLNNFEYKYYILHDAVELYLDKIIKEYLQIDPDNEYYKLINQHKNKIFVKEILVIPPDFRPISQINSNTKSVDQINQYYNQFLVRKELMEKIDIDITQHIKVYHSYYMQFQYIYNELYEFIIQKISKKEGLIRGNILGKRVDFSGRAVIAPSPNINLDECILPYKMVLELYKIKIAKYLYNSGKFKFLNQALLCVEECQFYNDPRLLPICRKIIGDDVCIINRQPSLHKLSFMAFKIKVDIVDVIYIHPLVCHGFNADFDGDSILSNCQIRKQNGDYITIHIADLKNTELFKYIPEKEKENISYYKPNEKLFIEAINLENGNIEEKEITEYTEHRNLNLYSIHDPQNRFEDFWVSDDHSLIVYDEKTDEYQKISPVELLKNPNGKYIVQRPK